MFPLRGSGSRYVPPTFPLWIAMPLCVPSFQVCGSSSLRREFSNDHCDFANSRCGSSNDLCDLPNVHCDTSYLTCWQSLFTCWQPAEGVWASAGSVRDSASRARGAGRRTWARGLQFLACLVAGWQANPVLRSPETGPDRPGVTSPLALMQVFPLSLTPRTNRFRL